MIQVPSLSLLYLNADARGRTLGGWIDALAAALRRLGDDRTAARQKAEQAVLEIQGALVLTRALDDIKVFSRALADSRKRLMNKK
jgi:TetR/AcrR family transcriptional regulator, lmrAB and yxaGH operons repressor